MFDLSQKKNLKETNTLKLIILKYTSRPLEIKQIDVQENSRILALLSEIIVDISKTVLFTNMSIIHQTVLC